MKSKTMNSSIKWRINNSRGPYTCYSDQDPFHLWVDFETYPKGNVEWIAFIYKVQPSFECVKIFSGKYKSKSEAMIAAYREWEARR